MRARVMTIIGALAVFALSGCESEIESSSSPPAAAAGTQPADDAGPAGSAGSAAGGGGRSTPGRAKDSAKSTIGKVEERDRALQKEMDDK